SLTALSIMGLLPMPPAKITNGEIFFYSNDKKINLLNSTSKEFEKVRGNEISMIFQEPMTSLNPLKKCGEQVAESIRLHQKISNKEAMEKTLQWFEEVQLPNPTLTIEKYPHEISGGQKQRVMIAMALCNYPKLLIADEPTTALDVSVQKTILDLLKSLQQKNKMAMLFITHDLSLVKEFADNVMVLHKGKCVEKNDTKSLFEQPQENYTKGLIFSRPNPNQRVHFLNTIDEFLALEKKPQVFISKNEFEEKINLIQQQENIIELKNLNLFYNTNNNFFSKNKNAFHALKDINLIVKKGETLGLVGESGCGKTTLGKAIIGLEKYSSGEILFQEKSISSFSKNDWKAYRRKVQLIFQDPYSSLNPRINIGEAIKETMDVHHLFDKKIREEKVIELLQKVGLQADFYKRYPHEFSGGQRQRISIARALALQPEVLICDESVSALDVSVQAQVLNLLVSLREEFQLTYLFISHDLGVIKHISDHIAVMQKGELVEYNDAENLYSNPKNNYTKALLENSFL
ncbi:MAG: ABC transporter ATP-binding protein, partial [Chitinophagaceae bacterium]|nr:ABC transporter ATP-binding protein [Chitinophagaceae bacterium]